MVSEQFKAQFEADLAANNHELFVFTFSEMGEIIAKHPKGNLPQVRKAWAQIKKPAEVGANYYASADDTLLLAKLIGDLGGFRAQAYIKSYQGKPYIILKGNPGLRNILTGTRYSLHNAKVVSMGLGKVAVEKAIVAGGKLTLVLLAAYRVVDYILSDEATLTRLIGSLATDVVKLGITMAASWGAVAVVGAKMAAATLAIGPLAAVIFVGVVTSLVLGALDEKFQITERLIAALDELAIGISNANNKLKDAAQKKIDGAANSVIDYVFTRVGRAAERIVWKKIDQFLGSRPRLM